MKKTLKVLAALVWYIGGIVLLFKGLELIVEAIELQINAHWHWVGVVGGFAFGVWKSGKIFEKSIKRNLARIDELENPRLWDFYSGKFFIALALMISAGVTLSRISHGYYPMLIGVGGLDLSLATALLSSSWLYWKK